MDTDYWIERTDLFVGGISLWVGRPRTLQQTSRSQEKRWTRYVQPFNRCSLFDFFCISFAFRTKLGVMSHQRASAAQKSGRFTAEIMPFYARLVDPAKPDSPSQSVVITEDDGIRHNASLESFAKAKSAFPQWGEGKSTGPNSSQVTDGAAATVLMRRSKAVIVTPQTFLCNLKKKTHRRSSASRSSGNIFLRLSSVNIDCDRLSCEVMTVLFFSGVTPKHMGIGPVFAIP